MSRGPDLWITAQCDDDRCDGTVRFGAAGSRRRRVGSCDRCGLQYSLYAGEITPLPHVGVDDSSSAAAANTDDHHRLAG